MQRVRKVLLRILSRTQGAAARICKDSAGKTQSCRAMHSMREKAAEMNINETGLHDRFKRGFVNINDLIKLLDSLDMDLIIRDRRYNR